MKIEKINENQIRCTLTKADLEDRQIRLSELAYGTEKAKSLFRDMMQQANIEFGFEADNIPLMIEAIPISMDSIVLIITKVEEPDELDTRFSKFTPFSSSGNDTLSAPPAIEGADDILDLFQKVYDARSKAAAKKKSSKPQPASSETNTASASSAKSETSEEDTEIKLDLIRNFTFHTLDDVILASKALNHFFTGKNSLYKDDFAEEYSLVLHQSGSSPSDFNKVCNMLSEYGSGKSFSLAGEAHLIEHADCILSGHALEQLADL